MALMVCLLACEAEAASAAASTAVPTAASVAASAAASERKTLHIEPSQYAPVVIYETATQRCMTFRQADNPDAETCDSLANPTHVAFDYTRMMVSALVLKPAPKRILIIGLGGGTLARTFAMLVPQAHIDSVEIDPAVVDMAAHHFGFRTSKRQQVHIGDGREFAARAIRGQQRYDLVMLDAFGANYIPAHLMTREFLTIISQVLAPEGIVVANTAGAGPLYARETETYQAVFGAILNFPAHNRIIMASPGQFPSDEALNASAQAWRAKFATVGIDPSVFLGRLQRLPASDSPETEDVLTDANVEQAIADATSERNRK